MPATTIEQRRAALQQQKAKLAERERKLAETERKARVRRLIELGGLVAKAGLDQMATSELYGALLGVRTAANDPLQVRRWATEGGAAFNKEARAHAAETQAAAE